MRITASVTKLNININGHMSKIRSDRFWTYAATEWHRLYKDYCPMKNGVLYNQVVIGPKEIVHTAPYAHYLYEGKVYGPNYPIFENGRIAGYFSQPGRPKKPTGKPMEYSKQYHSKASREWDKAAVPTQKPKLARSLQNYVNSGRLKLNG